MRPYPDVPLWWYGLTFLVSVLAMVVILGKGLLFIPIWTYFVALAIGAASIVPLGWLCPFSIPQISLQRQTNACRRRLQLPTPDRHL